MATSDSEITIRGFPFLDDEKTIKYIQHSKVMFIMRGISGSGKSTIVAALQKTYPENEACSADDHFLQEDGSYKWDKAGLTAAHEECQAKAKSACSRNVNVVIIDNTNICRWEIKPYVAYARDFCYTVIVVTPKTAWYLDVKVLAMKNKHGVQEVKIREKVEQFQKENFIPYYWGWFLNEKATDKILALADKYFSMCAAKCPPFAQYFKENVVGPGKELTFGSLFQRDENSPRTLHCTGYFCGRHSHPEAERYASSPDVIKNTGRCYATTVIGIVITPRTVGARIKLSNKQLKLWKRDDQDDGGPKKQTSALASRFAALAVDDDENDIPERFQPTHGEGSRAHFTLGLAPGVAAVQTGIEQVKVIQLEGERLDDDECIETEGAAIRYYDDGRCVVYFDEPVIVPSLFSGCY